MRRTTFETCAIAMPGVTRTPTNIQQKFRRDFERAPRSRGICLPLDCGWMLVAIKRP
jgi:hypothetical protein